MSNDEHPLTGTTHDARGRPATNPLEALLPEATRISIVYFEDCPNWKIAKEHVETALAALGATHVTVELVCVETEQQAQSAGLHGSPTVLVNGKDPFAPPGTPTALACRAEGAPTVEQLLDVLTHR